MNSFISKTVAFVILVLMLAVSAAPVDAVAAGYSTSAPAKPSVSETAVFSGKIELALNNPNDYDDETTFEIWVDGQKTAAKTKEEMAAAKYIFNVTGGTRYFAPNTKHSVKISAMKERTRSAFSTCIYFTTKAKTVYYASKGTAYYKMVNGKMVSQGTLPEAGYYTAVMTDKNGQNCEGKSVSKNTGKYILVTEGSCKDCYLSISSVRRKTDEQVAAATPAAPQLTCEYICSDQISVGISNISAYAKGTVFDLYVDGKKLRTVTLAEFKNLGFMPIYNNGSSYLVKSRSYEVTVEAVRCQLSAKAAKTYTTESTTYYKAASGAAYYTYSNGTFTYAGTTGYLTYGEGVRTTADGRELAGLEKSNTCAYVRFTTGELAGKYVKVANVARTTKAAALSTSRQAKIQKVVNYALANVGGRYVSCGVGYRATDCSGLTMLAYQQIGVSLPHSAYGQMLRGTRVSASNMQPGDIIIANGYNHAMMYVGNGMVVHAMNWRDGIRMQAASTAMYYNPVNAIVRII